MTPKFDFLGNRNAVVERSEDKITTDERDFSGEARAFCGNRLFGDLHEDWFALRQLVGDYATLFDVGAEFDFRERGGSPGVGDVAIYKSLIRCELRAEVEVVKKSLLIIAHVDEGGIEPREEFFHLTEVDVADGVGAVARLFLHRNEARVLQQSDRRF